MKIFICIIFSLIWFYFCGKLIEKMGLLDKIKNKLDNPEEKANEIESYLGKQLDNIDALNLNELVMELFNDFKVLCILFILFFLHIIQYFCLLFILFFPFLLVLDFSSVFKFCIILSIFPAIINTRVVDFVNVFYNIIIDKKDTNTKISKTIKTKKNDKKNLKTKKKRYTKRI